MEKITNEILNYHCPRYCELPNIDLYMDQVISTIEKALCPLYGKNDGKFVTPSMINNYVKQKVIAPPVNKKYSTNQVADLIVVCALKKIMSIGDIATVMAHSKSELATTYDIYCTQLEVALKSVFTFNKLPDDFFNTESTQSKLTSSIILALANKIFIEKTIEYINNNRM